MGGSDLSALKTQVAELQKSYNMIKQEAVKAALAAFDQAQKTIAPFASRLKDALAGKTVEFSPSEQATLSAAARETNALLTTQPFLSPENAAALKGKLGTAQALQKIAAQQQTPALSEEQKQAIAQKIATGEHRKKDPSQGGTQSVIGWQTLDDDVVDAQNNTIKESRFKVAKAVLEQNPIFVDLLKEFADPTDSASDNFGAETAGKYAKVRLEFEVLPEQTMVDLFGMAGGIVQTQVRLPKTNRWFDVLQFNGQRTDLGNLDENIRVYIALKNQDKDKLPTGNLKAQPKEPYVKNQRKEQKSDDFADPIVLITHEFIIHARDAAERVYQFKENMDSVNALKREIVGSTFENAPLGSAEKRFSCEHQLISGIDENGNPGGRNSEYERTNDATYELLKNPPQDANIPKLVRKANKGSNPGKPEATDDYVPRGQLDAVDIHGNKLDYIEQVTPDEAFLVARLSERQTYTPPKHMPTTNKNIAKEYDDAKKTKK